jgi:hypothetical protein
MRRTVEIVAAIPRAAQTSGLRQKVGFGARFFSVGAGRLFRPRPVIFAFRGAAVSSLGELGGAAAPSRFGAGARAPARVIFGRPATAPAHTRIRAICQ